LQDASSGPVFQPPKDDYAKTFELGSKNSKTRKQYDTGRTDRQQTLLYGTAVHYYDITSFAVTDAAASVLPKLLLIV
jgi:hypothetical protein